MGMLGTWQHRKMEVMPILLFDSGLTFGELLSHSVPQFSFL